MQVKVLQNAPRGLNTNYRLMQVKSIAECSKGIQDQLSLNAGQKYCRMLQGDSRPIIT